jgi:protease-4
MKNFITSMLGALVALFIFALGALVLLAGIVGAIATLTARKAVSVHALVPGSYLVFDLSTNITDAPPPYDFGAFGKDGGRTLQLRAVTRAIQAAAKDDRIAGIFIMGSLDPQGYGSGYPALREVRGALTAFRKSGKPVKAYIDYATTKDFYLASVANEITLDPYGIIYMPGLATEPVFFGGMFGKYGVGVQVTRVGKYKAYVEQYTRQDMSPENRTQTQLLLNDIWSDLESEIGRARGLAPARIQAVADTEGLIRADAAKRAGLVDRIAYGDQVIDGLKALTGPGASKESFKQIPLYAYLRLAPRLGDEGSGPGVAVVYAEGDIVEGEGEVGQVGGVSYARELRRIRADDSIKAVVLRVNSPGGSVGASEEIQREIRLTREKKPVIVSMGAYAASGGYWISTYADRIFAEPTTITGSIGVFGIQLDVQKLLGSIGITFDRVKTGRLADLVTISRPKTDEEMAVFQRLVDWIYEKFVGKVSEGRHLRPGYVGEIAQGRVWSGGQALRLGLVDEIGGLDAAIRYAARKGNLGERYRVTEYPRKKDFAEALAELLGRLPPESVHLRSDGLVGEVESRFEGEMGRLRALNDSRGVYARLPVELELK